MENLYSELKPEDLEQYGIKPELIGRLPVLTHTMPLTADILIDIMKNGKKSVFNQQLSLLQKGYGLSVTVDEEVYRMLASAAQQLGTGARGLESASNKLFQDIKFNIKDLTKGTTTLNITPQMAYQRLQKMLPETYTF